MPLNMNLVPVYEELKYTGKGIRVAIIDDGIEHTHDDLKDNYVSMFHCEYYIWYLLIVLICLAIVVCLNVYKLTLN